MGINFSLFYFYLGARLPADFVMVMASIQFALLSVTQCLSAILQRRKKRRASRRWYTQQELFEDASLAETTEELQEMVILLCHTVYCSLDFRQIRWWKMHRNSSWFDDVVLKIYGEARFLRMFRMRKMTFFWLVEKLGPTIERRDTKFRKAIPVTVRLGIILYRLAHGSSYFLIAEKFGVGESSVRRIVSEGVDAIIQVLGPTFLTWPATQRLAEISRGFQQICGLPNVQGAVDATHVKILAPPGRDMAADFHNRKGFFSILLQAIVDHEGMFLDIFAGMPGSVNDKRLIRNSGFYRRVQARTVLVTPSVVINDGFILHPYILGDAGYMLQPWCMVPYSGRSLSLGESAYNAAHTRGRIIVEQAFGLLKGKWRILSVGIQSEHEWAPQIVHACTILHNILMARADQEIDENLAQRTALEPIGPEDAPVRPDAAGEKREQLRSFICLA